MTRIDVLDRARRANPVREADALDDSAAAALLARILVSPRDAADGPEGRSRHSFPRPRRRVVVAVVLSVAATATVLAPWQRGGPTVVDRALAAVGDGPVVHAVIRDTLGMRIDLQSGAATPISREVEFWFDQRDRAVRSIIRQDGEQISDQLGRGGGFSLLETPLGAAAFYRQALAEGRAREIGDGVVRGRSVIWLQLVEPTRDIRAAVDSESFALVALQERRDGEVDHQLDILVLETATRGQAGLDRAAADQGGVGVSQDADSLPLTLAEARTLFDEPALWAGPGIAGHELSMVSRAVVTIEPGGRSPIELILLRLRYGPPAPAGGIEIEQAPAATAATAWRAQGEIAPPAGHVDVMSARTPRDDSVLWSGRMQIRGFYVRLAAPTREALLAAARSLTPLSSE